MPAIGKNLIGRAHCSRDEAIEFLDKFLQYLKTADAFSLQDVLLVGFMAEERSICRMTRQQAARTVELTDRRRAILLDLIRKAKRNSISCDEITLICIPDPDFDRL